jgi:hypothetical protein
MAPTEADLDKAYAAAFDAIQDRLKARLNRKSFLTFSAYGIDQNKLPIDNLDEVPGKIRLRAPQARSVDGRSRILKIRFLKIRRGSTFAR